MHQSPLQSKKFLMTLIALLLVTAVAIVYAYLDPSAIAGIFTTFTTGLIAALTAYISGQSAVDHRLAKNGEKPKPAIGGSFEEPTVYKEYNPKSPPSFRSNL